MLQEEEAALTSWGWAWRSIWMCGVLLCAGWAVGGALSLWSPTAALAGVGISGILVAAPWAVVRLGGAGLGAALIYLIAGLGAGIEVHRAWVAAEVEVIEAPSVSRWPAGAAAVRVPGVLHDASLRATASWTTKSGKSSTTNHYQAAVPLVEVEGGPVVAFDCHGGFDRPDPDGPVLLLLRAWEGGGVDNTCARPIRAAVEKIRAAGRPLAPGAEARVVRVFQAEEFLRRAHDLQATLSIPFGFYVFYVLCSLIFQRSGLRSAKEG
jgi:hypothetical protein